MRFEDEQYVRLYKRDTTTWKMMPWQSRCILPLILRKLDRAGILDLGDDGLEALAVHIEVPIEVVLEGMPAILRRGVLVLREDGLLVWPKFIDGQEAKQSDKARQKSARDRARDLASAADRGVDAVTICDATVTPRDANDTPRDGTVTRGHTVSQSVTLSSADLSSAQLSQDPICPTSPDGDGSDKPESKPRDPRPDDVWSHYVATMKRHRPRRRPTDLAAKDRKSIEAHLRSGLSVADLNMACDGLFRSQHHLGMNDRNTEYLEIKYALRNPQTFIALAEDFRPERGSGTRPVADVEPERVDPALIDAELAKLDAVFA